jgi:hypothetical protein
MQPLDIVKHLQVELSAESRKATLNTLLLNQIQVLEKVIETNGAFVEDAGAYNTVAGLIAQLKFWVPSIYSKPEHNLDMVDLLKPSIYTQRPAYGEAT